MAKIEVKSLNSPDDMKQFEKLKMEIVKIGDATISRSVYQPGWRWSKHVKPIAQTKSCEVTHLVYVVSGTMHVVMDDGTEKDVKTSDVALIPAGHDGWVVGNEPAVLIGFQGVAD